MIPFAGLFWLTACGTPADTDDTDLPQDTDASDTDGVDDTDVAGDTDAAAPLAIDGVWADPWATLHEISDDAWVQTYAGTAPLVFEVSRYNNADHVVIAHNAVGNLYNPDQWSRFDWVEADAVLYYCQTAYGAATEADAIATPAAESDDLEAGCGGAPWSPLEAPLDLRGAWVDDYDTTHVIDEATWVQGTSVFHVTRYDNAAHVLIAHNDAANDYSPDLWSRFDWSTTGAQRYFCQTVYDGPSEAAASDATAADAGDLDAGCAGFAWSELNAAP